MSYNPDAAFAEAKRHVGFHEGPNNDNPFTRWQTGFTSLQPWCDSFCCYCAQVGGGYMFPFYSLFGAKGDWNVGAHHQHAVRQGIWRNPYFYVARRGDLVVLNFNEVDQHIEMVDLDMGPGHFPRLVTIGGNTNDQVAWRSRYSGNIGGFIALTVDVPAPGPTPPPPPPPPPTQGDELLTTIAQPGRVKKGRQGTARAVPAFGCIVLDNGASLHGDKNNGINRVWVSRDPAVIANGHKLIDITPPLGADGKPQGSGVVALYQLAAGDVGTYSLPWS